MSPPLEHVSGLVPPHQREQIAAVGGDRGLSAGLRDVITAGLAALQGDAALVATVDELHALADRLATIQGRRTPAGAWWAPTPEALPDPAQLNPDGDVIATPDGVGLIANEGTFTIELEAGVLVVREDGRELATEVDLNSLLPVACLLPAAVAGLASTGPGRRDLGSGVMVTRTTRNLCRLTVQGIGVTAPAEVVLAFAAELVSLVARGVTESAIAREQLERQLEVSP